MTHTNLSCASFYPFVKGPRVSDTEYISKLDANFFIDWTDRPNFYVMSARKSVSGQVENSF